MAAVMFRDTYGAAQVRLSTLVLVGWPTVHQ
jgi:hypothetical protein